MDQSSNATNELQGEQQQGDTTSSALPAPDPSAPEPSTGESVTPSERKSDPPPISPPPPDPKGANPTVPRTPGNPAPTQPPSQRPAVNAADAARYQREQLAQQVEQLAKTAPDTPGHYVRLAAYFRTIPQVVARYPEDFKLAFETERYQDSLRKQQNPIPTVEEMAGGPVRSSTEESKQVESPQGGSQNQEAQTQGNVAPAPAARKRGPRVHDEINSSGEHVIAVDRPSKLNQISTNSEITGEDLIQANPELADHPNNIPAGTKLNRPQHYFWEPIESGAKALLGRLTYQPITEDQLKTIMPRAGKETIGRFLGPLNEAMRKYQINTRERQASFLAQIAEETGEMRVLKEGADGSDYEGRLDLGNTEPGDGSRFPGRGLLQTTGRSGYLSVGKELGVDLINHPELLETPKYAALSAAWYFKTHGENLVADKANFRGVTGIVNGAEDGPKTHLDVRVAYYQRARRAFGLPEWIDSRR